MLVFPLHLSGNSDISEFLVVIAVGCGEICYVSYLINDLVFCIKFLITIMFREVITKQEHYEPIKAKSNCVRSINLVHRYLDLVLIRNLRSTLINFILKDKYVGVCGTLKVRERREVDSKVKICQIFR